MKKIILFSFLIAISITFSSCKKETIPNINNTTWTVNYSWTNNSHGNYNLTFNSDHSHNMNGTWSQSGSSVTFTYLSMISSATYTGTVTTSNTMSGSITDNHCETNIGTWSASLK